MNRYGLPYMGSKNQIAEWVVDKLPKATHFYDLFCGGCSITHCAITKNKYKQYHINDINPLIVNLFIDAISGKFKDEKRWISREDFFNLKEQDGYIKYCWSFGNKGDTYLYSKDLEDIKKAVHYAIVYDDYDKLKQYGLDYSELKNIIGINEKRKYTKKILDQTNNNNIIKKGSHFIFKGIINFDQIQNIESLCRVQNIESLCRDKIYYHTTDYQDIKIEDDSVIYCDIPYFNTGSYNDGESFDYERFYSWAEKQKKIFISEYWMPEDRFRCIDMVSKLSILSATNNSLKKVEKIFIPINNEYTPSQLSLW